MHTGAAAVVGVVLPLRDGTDSALHELLADGPPFDPTQIGLERRHVLLTEHEAIFVFVSTEGIDAVESLLHSPELWDRAAAWRDHLAGLPRTAEDVYAWTRSEPAEARRCVTAGFDF
jgi:hypothetical protein